MSGPAHSGGGDVKFFSTPNPESFVSGQRASTIEALQRDLPLALGRIDLTVWGLMLFGWALLFFPLWGLAALIAAGLGSRSPGSIGGKVVFALLLALLISVFISDVRLEMRKLRADEGSPATRFQESPEFRAHVNAVDYANNLIVTGLDKNQRARLASALKESERLLHESAKLNESIYEQDRQQAGEWNSPQRRRLQELQDRVSAISSQLKELQEASMSRAAAEDEFARAEAHQTSEREWQTERDKQGAVLEAVLNRVNADVEGLVAARSAAYKECHRQLVFKDAAQNLPDPGEEVITPISGRAPLRRVNEVEAARQLAEAGLPDGANSPRELGLSDLAVSLSDNAAQLENSSVWLDVAISRLNQLDQATVNTPPLDIGMSGLADLIEWEHARKAALVETMKKYGLADPA